LPQYIDYYLDNLDAYYNAKDMASKFIDTMMTQSLSDLKKSMHKIKTEIVDHIRYHPQFIEFMSKDCAVSEYDKITMRHDVYNPKNDKKRLISVDIKSAYFRIVKHYCPEVFTNDWQTFLKNYTNVPFLLQSKMFREIVFGDLNCKKIHKLQIVLIHDVYQAVQSSHFASLIKPIYCFCDEIVYEIDKSSISAFDYDLFSKLINDVHFDYFHIRMFDLVQLGQRPFFFKNYIRPHDIKKEFKAVPKKFIMQAIKFYEYKPIIELDRKFIDESGYVATFDKSIFDY